MDLDLVIRNGLVVTSSTVSKADIGIRGEKIALIADKIDSVGRLIDATGMYVFPGGVEIHTHIDGILHGMRTVDDWFYASLGAAYGGTTTVVDFPMQGENQSLSGTINEFRERAFNKSIIDYSFTPIISRFTDDTYREIPSLIDQGITSFKIFMYYGWKVDDFNLARSLDVIGRNGGIASIHCENAGTIDYLISKSLLEGRTGVEWHAPTRPASTEVEATSRVLHLAKELHVPVLIVHMSAGPAVVELAKARAEGVLAYGETMPHFLCLDESEYQKPGYEPMKVVITPPLRSKENQSALWDGLQSGVISTIGSDHCAFPFKDKIRLYETRGSVFPMIPHGAPGIETQLPVIFSEGVCKNRISLSKFVEVISTNPARLTGMYPQKGTIAVGSDADLVMVDPRKEIIVSNKNLHGRTDYTPFEGWSLLGSVETTISRGKVIIDNGEFFGESGCGKFIRRNEFKPF